MKAKLRKASKEASFLKQKGEVFGSESKRNQFKIKLKK